MIHRQTIVVGIVLGVACLLGKIPSVQARTPLTSAEIQRLRNQVEFIPDGASARPAQLSDQLVPGDALTTRQQAFAELEFNDGTLARLGELALFYFQPETRTFDLEQGTVLLLIPPDQGTSQLRTPNATAGIRGSGLFGRFIKGATRDESVTLIGALTTSGIEVTNNVAGSTEASQDGGESGDSVVENAIELEAGHIAVIVGDRPPQVFTFDLDIFYQTSNLVQGLALAGADTSANTTLNDAVALVRQETQAGLAEQEGTLSQPHVDNPFFIHSPWTIESTSAFSGQPTALEQPTEDFTYSDTLDNVLDTADILTPTDIVNVEDVIPEPVEVLVPEPPVTPPMIPDPIPDPINPPFAPVAPVPDVPMPPVTPPMPDPIPDLTPDPGLMPDPAPMPDPDPAPMPDPDPAPMPDPDPAPMPAPNPAPMPAPDPDPVPEPDPMPDPDPDPDPDPGIEEPPIGLDEGEPLDNDNEPEIPEDPTLETSPFEPADDLQPGDGATGNGDQGPIEPDQGF